MAFPLRKYFPMMHGSSIDEQDIAPDTILEGDIADDAVTSDKIIDDAVIAGKLAADSIPNTAAIVKIISPNAFDAAALVDVIADDAFDEATVDALFAAGAIDAADRLKSGSITDDRIGTGVIADDKLVSSIVKEVGRISVGLVDFNAVGDCTSVDVGATAVYTRHDTTQDSPAGVWEDGATADDSATNLALAINGDTRNDSGPYYAAVAVGSTCWIMGLAVGSVNNVNIVKTGGTDPDVQENLVGGADATVKQVLHIQHTVTAEEQAQVELVIPLPFDVAFFEWHVYDTNGGILATEVTDYGTVTGAAGTVPAYFKIATNGATHITSGQIVRLTVTN